MSDFNIGFGGFHRILRPESTPTRRPNPQFGQNPSYLAFDREGGDSFTRTNALGLPFNTRELTLNAVKGVHGKEGTLHRSTLHFLQNPPAEFPAN